jgi:protein-disulfide isomerase
MRVFRFMALLLAGVLAIAATAPNRAAPPRPPVAAVVPVQVTPIGSHLFGNPAAKVKVTEYISYTCPHCAHFEEQSTAPLWQKYLPTGAVSVEVRHLVRDPVDMVAAALANCGPPVRFFGNHAMFLEQQARWIQTIAKADDAQRKRWEAGPLPQRMKTIATDFGFYAMMQTRGYTRAQVDACLTDDATLKRLAAMTEGAGKLGINGTPGLMLDGTPLAGTYDWATLEPQIEARL